MRTGFSILCSLMLALLGPTHAMSLHTGCTSEEMPSIEAACCCSSECSAEPEPVHSDCSCDGSGHSEINPHLAVLSGSQETPSLTALPVEAGSWHVQYPLPMMEPAIAKVPSSLHEPPLLQTLQRFLN